jgi:hypothetical protein
MPEPELPKLETPKENPTARTGNPRKTFLGMLRDVILERYPEAKPVHAYLGERMPGMKLKRWVFYSGLALFLSTLTGVIVHYTDMQVLPKVLHAVDVRLAIYILASGVIYSLVIVAALFQSLIGLQFIRVNCGTVQNVFLDNRLQSFLGNIRNNFRHHLSFALHHAKDDCFVRSTTATDAVSATANVSLINFNIAKQRPFIVNLCHVLADMGCSPHIQIEAIV